TYRRTTHPGNDVMIVLEREPPPSAFVTSPPVSRRPRRKDPHGDNDIFGSFAPSKNPSAVYAYRLAPLGMIPFLGLICGPLALIFGWLGVRKYRENPEVNGLTHCRFATALGGLVFVTNLAGTICIAAS